MSPVVIPDVQDAPPYPAQAFPDKVDLTAIAGLGVQTGVVSGCITTPHTSARSVDVSAGVISYLGTPQPVLATTALAPSASSSTDRRDIVQVSSAGIVSIKAGTPCAAGAPWTPTSGSLPPVKPVPDSTCQVVAELYIQGGSGANFTTNEILLKTADYLAGGGGGGSPHGLNVVALPFAYNKAGILTGATMYTPNNGDVVYDAWIEIDTAWNGLTPSLDLGTFDATLGMLNVLGCPPIKLSAADLSLAGFGVNTGLLVAGGPSSISATMLQAAINNNVPVRRFTWRFNGTNPVKIVVSQDGTGAGAVAASLIAASPPALPITVTGSQVDFAFLGTDPVLGGGNLAAEMFSFAFSTYSTLTAVKNAMAAATGAVSGEAFSTKCTVGTSGSVLKLTAAVSGAAANGNQIQAGDQDISAALGFAVPSVLAGGVGGDPGSTQGSGVLYLVVGTP